jgi:hypothetical protein
MKIVTEDNWLHGSHSNWVYSEQKYGLAPHNQLGCVLRVTTQHTGQIHGDWDNAFPMRFQY